MAKTLSPLIIDLNLVNHYVITGGGLSIQDTLKVINPATPCEGTHDHDSMVTSNLHSVTNNTNTANVTFVLKDDKLKSNCLDGMRVCYRHEAGQYVYLADIVCSSGRRFGSNVIETKIPAHLTPTAMGSPGLTWAQGAAAAGN